jgi:hypothetical protein
LTAIKQCEFRTAADLQQFRIRTQLIFHNPGVKRAFGGASLPGGGKAAVSGLRPHQTRGTVLIFHYLIYHEIGENIKFRFFTSQFIMGLMAIKQCEFRTAADLQQFRI